MTIKKEKTIWLMIAAYAIFFSIFTALRHSNFQTQAWDMGIFDQLFWNTVHGRFMQSSIEEIPRHFGIHFSPFLLLLLPGYALFQSPYYLLIVQTLALALGAYPLYLIANKKLSAPFPLLISTAYLLSPSLHWINTFDFHEVAFFIPLFLTAFYFFYENKFAYSAIFFTLAAGTKEDAIVAVIFAGLFITVQSYLKKDATKIRFGLFTVIGSIIMFILAIKVIMPAFGGGLLRMDRYRELGVTATEIIKNSITNPKLPISLIFQLQKLKYLFWLFLPAAFLPFFSWPSLILILPGILENTLTNFPSQFSGHYQYDATILPGLFIGMIFGIEFLSKKWLFKKEKKLWVIILIALFLGFLLRSPVSPIFFPINPIKLFLTNPQKTAISELLAKVPYNASVTAPTNFVPHLANREKIYVLGTEPFLTDIVLIDGADLSGFANEETFQAYADNYMASGNYIYEEIQNRYFIFKKKTP